MGQSLSNAAVRGITNTVAEQKQALLDAGDIDGLMALNATIFGGFTMVAKDDQDDDQDDDNDDPDDDQDDDDEDDDEDDEDEKSKKTNERLRQVSAEAKKYRQRASQRGTRIKELEAEIQALKGKKPSKKIDDEESNEDVSEEVEKERQRAETLAKANDDLLIRLEFTTSTKYEWKNPKTALRLLDLSDVEITEDGEVEGLEEAMDALAESEPYLLKEKASDDEDDEPKTKKTGQPTGGSRKKGNANRDRLVSKYPALRR